MSAKAYCNDRGVTVVQVAEHMSKEPQTIHNWHNSNEPLFQAAVNGTATALKGFVYLDVAKGQTQVKFIVNNGCK
jgi:hypothetical protein